MRVNEINTWTAWQMAEAINRGDVSAEEVTQSCLDRIAERENAVKAWAFWDPDLALKQARACDEQRSAGNPLDLLHGVPVGLKDIIDTADMPPKWQPENPGWPVWSQDLQQMISALKLKGAISVHIEASNLSQIDAAFESVAALMESGGAAA